MNFKSLFLLSALLINSASHAVIIYAAKYTKKKYDGSNITLRVLGDCHSTYINDPDFRKRCEKIEWEQQITIGRHAVQAHRSGKKIFVICEDARELIDRLGKIAGLENLYPWVRHDNPLTLCTILSEFNIPVYNAECRDEALLSIDGIQPFTVGHVQKSILEATNEIDSHTDYGLKSEFDEITQHTREQLIKNNPFENSENTLFEYGTIIAKNNGKYIGLLKGLMGATFSCAVFSKFENRPAWSMKFGLCGGLSGIASLYVANKALQNILDNNYNSCRLNNWKNCFAKHMSDIVDIRSTNKLYDVQNTHEEIEIVAGDKHIKKIEKWLPKIGWPKTPDKVVGTHEKQIIRYKEVDLESFYEN